MSVNLSFLDALGDKIEAAAVTALKESGEKVKGDAKRLAPAKSGRLRSGITSKYKRDETTGEHTVTVGTNLTYAPYVEFGTGPVGEQSGYPDADGLGLSYSAEGWTYKDENGQYHKTNGQPARPFLYPALKQNEAFAKELVEKAVKRVRN